jgi:hypothetical protein
MSNDSKYLEAINPSLFYEAVTPSDTDNFTGPVGLGAGPGGDVLANAIFVGVGGIVVAIRDDDTAITFTGTISGSILPIKCKRINSTTTTATDMVALF